jgi:hypothetical protein
MYGACHVTRERSFQITALHGYSYGLVSDLSTGYASAARRKLRAA